MTEANIPSTVTYNGTTYSVTSIGSSAFSGCSGLTSVTIPNSVTSIGYEAFEYCSGLTSVTIPNSVTSIGGYAFYGCRGLTSVTIPNSVTSIGFYAFSRCSGLETIKVESGNAYFDSRDNCNALIVTATNTLFTGCKNTTIPNSVTSIYYEAFKYCSGLTSITIPNSVTEIGYNAFENCIGLTSVIWEVKSLSDFTDSSIPFNGCNNISSFVFGDEVERIPAFLCYGLNKLTSITIGNSVTSIGSYAFRGCSGLKRIIAGENLTSIGAGAFACPYLEDFVTLRERPIIISAGVFEGIPTASCDLHVRKGSKLRYEAQDVWKDFLFIFEDAEDYIDGIPENSNNGLKGDMNDDGLIDVDDVNEIINIILES